MFKSIITIAAMALASPVTAQTNPSPSEVLEAQIMLCAGVSGRENGLAILDNEMIKRGINAAMRLETLKICIAFDSGRLYQDQLIKKSSV